MVVAKTNKREKLCLTFSFFVGYNMGRLMGILERFHPRTTRSEIRRPVVSVTSSEQTVCGILPQVRPLVGIGASLPQPRFSLRSLP